MCCLNFSTHNLYHHISVPYNRCYGFLHHPPPLIRSPSQCQHPPLIQNFRSSTASDESLRRTSCVPCYRGPGEYILPYPTISKRKRGVVPDVPAKCFAGLSALADCHPGKAQTMDRNPSSSRCQVGRSICEKRRSRRNIPSSEPTRPTAHYQNGRRPIQCMVHHVLLITLKTVSQRISWLQHQCTGTSA